MPVAQQIYQQRIRAWALYDWANSAFATTILAAVLPVYYSQVAGATLPSDAVATAYWSIGLSISLLITALISPILGTISDVVRAKKKFLAFFTAVGVIGTGLLVLVDTGDWLLASGLFIIARIGFVAAYTFYDSLLPHVAKPEDQDRVSTRGYAMGYLGGGVLLAINVVMIFVLPGTWGARLSFLSVAIWWAMFSIPLFLQVPEPPCATETLKVGESVVGVSIRRLRETLKDITHYRELFKYLIAFLIYNDAIGTIIGVAAIYGAELGLGTVDLILALLLVQFVGIPFSLIFGRLPSREETRRHLFLAFIVFNLVTLPIAGVIGLRALPPQFTGVPQAVYATNAPDRGAATFAADDTALRYDGVWTQERAPTEEGQESAVYAVSDAAGASYEFAYTGLDAELTYRTGPNGGIWAVELDGQPVMDADTSTPLHIDAYSPTVRYDAAQDVSAETPGNHVLRLVNTGDKNPSSAGTEMNLRQIVLPPLRQSNLAVIIGLIAALQLVGVAFAALFGRSLFGRLAETLDTRRSILLSLVIYSVIAMWGYFINSTIEFWFLAWLVAIVQGGSQALSRSLYSSMSPAMKSGEFFGLYGIMEKFSSIIGPLLFAFAVAAFASSRPAIVSLIVFFILGGYLLSRVNIGEGQRIAREEDAALAQAQAGG
jgi:MFS transporter, UMF1 family